MKTLLTNIFSVALLASGYTIASAQTFSYTGSLQTITVPACADSVTITAIGGGGGKGPYNAPGKGASIIGTFAVNPGNVLDMVVGQKGIGVPSGPYYCGSGGGGSYVWNTSSSAKPMIIAGGGGGSSYGSYFGGDGSADSIPTNSRDTAENAAGGSNGNGAAGGTCALQVDGGGGAGWYSNGGTGAGANSGGGGFSPANGAAGGIAGTPGGVGGYGGGGGCAGNNGSGGGGGGYNGGGGGQCGGIGNWGAGGGGGSYNMGANQVNTSGTNGGNGSVVILFKYKSAVPVGPIAGNISVCQGSSFSYSANSAGGGPFTWSVPGGATINSGQGTDTIQVTFGAASGNIKVVEHGCVNDSDSVAVTVHPLPTLILTASKDTICVNNTKDTLIGNPAGGTFSGTGVTGSNFNPNTAGAGVHRIKYVYTDTNGCTNSDSIMLVVNVCAGINEVVSLDNAVKLYPNPFSNEVNVNVDADGIVNISMFNMLGENMGTWKVSKGSNVINTQRIPAGVYTMEVKTHYGILNKKLVKMN